METHGETMTTDTDVYVLAQVGLAALGLVFFAYSFCLGFFFARPTKVEAQILVRALHHAPGSPDPIMAEKEAKLLKALKTRSERWL